MLISFLDTSTGAATAAAPTFHIIDTSAGLLQFVSGGASTAGTIIFNNMDVYTPPSVAVWAYLQSQIVVGLRNNVGQIQFNQSLMTVASYSPNPASAEGDTLTIIGTNFQEGMNASVDYTVGSALPIINCGVVTFINNTQIQVTIPAMTAGSYPLTLINSNKGYIVFSVTTA